MFQTFSVVQTFRVIFLVQVILVFAICSSTLLGQVQTSRLDVPKGTRVVLKIPAKIIGFEKVGTWSGRLNYGTFVEQSPTGRIAVGGFAEWRTAGWVLMRSVTLEKISANNKFTELEFRDANLNIKLRFDTTVKNPNAVFREVAFVGTLSEFEASEYYRTEVVEKMLPLIFTGRLASIPAKAKLRLLAEVQYIDSVIRTEVYKRDSYIVLDAGGDIQIYNTIHMGQSERMAHALNQRVLSYIKRVAKIINFHSEVDGIKVEVALPYKNFVTEYYNPPNYDRLEIYAPMDVIRQFTDDELTNQEFIEEVVLLVNGNRTRIPLLESR